MSFRLDRADYWTFGILLCFGLCGLISSFVLSVEKMHMLQDPGVVLSCSINVWLNCGSVMQTWQASVFGFPNSYIGLIAFPALISIASARLLGAVLPRVVIRLMHITALVGVLFAYWLFAQSVFVIRVLCPWCLVVTFSTTIIWESITRYSILHDTWALPAAIQQRLKGWITRDYHKLALITWLVVVCITVYWQFQDFL